jgi:4-amino-4-deoxy-L-arabinose transferase-like glycosyltransferase
MWGLCCAVFMHAATEHNGPFPNSCYIGWTFCLTIFGLAMLYKGFCVYLLALTLFF